MKNFINKIIYSDCIFFFGFMPYIGDTKQNTLNAIIMSVIIYINVRYVMNKITHFITNSINTYKEITRYI